MKARIDRLLPVSADLGPLAAVLERAGRPMPEDRSTAAEFGRALIAAAEKLPKPAPLPLVDGKTSLFESAPEGQETTGELTRFRDSTGATTRDPSATQGIPRPVRAVDPSGGIPRPRVVAVDDSGAETAEEVRRPRGPVLAYLALVVGLVAASAFAVVAYRKLTEKSYDVPSLIGLEEGSARNEIAGNDWQIVTRNEPSEAQPQGFVFRTDPPAGATLAEGEQFVLYVSAGPPLATIPDVSGQTIEEATASLQQAALGIAVGERRFDEEVPPGQIISWVVTAQPTLAAGDQVVRDTVITVVVSEGPAPREMPDLVGLTFEEAQQVVGQYALGVQADPEQVFSSDYEAGRVVAQSVGEGETIARGETVTVTISKGPDLVAVPDVILEQIDAVIEAINAAGLTVGEIEGDVFAGTLLGVSLDGRQVAIGELLPRGTAVDLVFL